MDTEKPFEQDGGKEVISRKGIKIIVVVFLLLSVSLTLIIISVINNSKTNPTYNPSVPSEIFNATDAIQRCLTLQYGKTEGNPEATQCFRDTLYLAVTNEQYDQIFALQDTIIASGAYGSCHSGGHLAGVDLVQDAKMDTILPKLFKTTVPGKDFVCTVGVVHGLVQGSALGEPPFDLEYLADQCAEIQKLKPEYGTECSHYYGHVAYKNYKKLGSDVAQTCEMLEEKSSPDMLEACVGGALMQELALQDANYDPDKDMDTSGIAMNPPTYTETIELCKIYDTYPNTRVLDSCWGGIGWVLAMRTGVDLQKNKTEDLETKVKSYVDGVNYCQFEQCVWTYINHLRPDDYLSDVSTKFCESSEIKVDFTVKKFKDMCNYIVAGRTGTQRQTENLTQ